MIALLHPRRILMTTDAVGGVWNYALELCRALRKYEIEVVLATLGPLPSAGQRDEASALDNVILCESDYRLEWMPEPWADVERAGRWLLELAWKYSPDLVHVNGFSHGALPWNVPCLVVAHSCVLSWWEAVRGTAAPADWEEYRMRVAQGIHTAEVVIAPSAAMRDAIVRHYGEPRTCRVILNGREPASFVRAAEKESFVLSVGRFWDEGKNIASLAAVAPHISWPVRAVGLMSGPNGNAPAPSGIEAVGRQSTTDLARLYSRAAIYALPARYEPFGLSVLEAALSGCALVLGDIASLRELWDGAAEFVPPDDHAALRATLRHLIQHPEQRARRAAQARLRAERYSTARMARSYLETYRSLLIPGIRTEAEVAHSA